MAESKHRRRWYHLSPDRLIVGLTAVEGFLLLSEQFQWFAFNEKKGWTVLDPPGRLRSTPGCAGGLSSAGWGGAT